MVSKMREVERKYELEHALPDMVGLTGVVAVSAPEAQSLDATYFDTADLRLVKSGITLRRRTGGGDAGWHLKVPVGPDAREETHVPLGVAEDEVPDELARLVRAHTRGTALVPVARIRTDRLRRLLLDADGRPLAEIVTDHVDARALREPPAATAWQEIEVELVEGGEDLLEAVDARLRAAGARAASTATKLERALGDRLPPSPPPPTDPPAD